MPDNDDLDSQRPRGKKAKKKRRPDPAPGLPIGLLVGAGAAGLLVVGLILWGLVSLFRGGAFGPVVAQARPADRKPDLPDVPAAPAVPLEQIPAAAPGWKVTPDGVALASGLTSAVALPEGDVTAVLFSDPAPALAAVVMTKKMLPPPEGTVVHTDPAYPVEWVPVDLKSGRVAAAIPLGDSYPGPRVSSEAKITNAALSPSGERLAAAFPGGVATAFRVWDKAGKRLLELPEGTGSSWLAFQSESRLLAYGGGKLTAIDVPSGAVTYTVNDVKAPVALSPGRKWVCAAAPGDGLKFFSAADGTPGGEIPKAGKVEGIAFSPDGASVAVNTGAVAVWDVATGKPAHAAGFQTPKLNDDRAPRIAWFGGKHLLLGGVLLDLERQLVLCEYDCRPYRVARVPSPDGRLWSAGSFKEVLSAGLIQKKATPGPIFDAGVKDAPLLAAFTVPHDDARQRREEAQNGIPFLPDEPARIEVTGYGSTAAKQKLADTAAAELAKRGKAVDPSAKVGVRIELGALKQVSVARGSALPGVILPVKPGDVRTAYQVEASVRLINLANGAVSRSPQILTRGVYGDEPDREAAILTAIGKQMGWQLIPLAGY
ncbi:MAG: WD40 repeat domain-containing protein, partial [Gemmataceae bacterium]